MSKIVQNSLKKSKVGTTFSKAMIQLKTMNTLSNKVALSWVNMINQAKIRNLCESLNEHINKFWSQPNTDYVWSLHDMIIIWREIVSLSMTFNQPPLQKATSDFIKTMLQFLIEIEKFEKIMVFGK